MLNLNIGNFINNALSKYKLTRKQFAENTGISYSSVNELINNQKANPAFSSILKIADTFEVSVDEILNINKSQQTKLTKLSQEEVMNNLRIYINSNLQTNHLTPRSLAIHASLAPDAIRDFIDQPPKKHTLGTNIIIQLATHWDVSIDEMIGRTKRNKEQTLNTPQAKSKSFVNKVTQRRANSVNKSRSR